MPSEQISHRSMDNGHLSFPKKKKTHFFKALKKNQKSHQKNVATSLEGGGGVGYGLSEKELYTFAASLSE